MDKNNKPSNEQIILTINCILCGIFYLLLLFSLTFNVLVMMQVLLILAIIALGFTSFKVKNSYIRVTGIVLEYILLVTTFKMNPNYLVNTVFILYSAYVVLNLRYLPGLLIAYLGYVFFLFIFDPNQIVFPEFIVSLMNYSVLIIPFVGIRYLLKQRKLILKLNDEILKQSLELRKVAKREERYRLAEEVHNTIGHTITGAIVTLEGAKMTGDLKGESREKIEIAQKALKSGLNDVRQVVRSMKETLNDDIDLEQSLIAYLNKIDQSSKVVELNIKKHNKNYDIMIIKWIKELINNSIKYSNGNKIDAKVYQLDNNIIIQLRDNGSINYEFEYGFGLNMIRENVSELKGRMSIETSHGFSITLEIPLE